MSIFNKNRTQEQVQRDLQRGLEQMMEQEGVIETPAVPVESPTLHAPAIPITPDLDIPAPQRKPGHNYRPIIQNPKRGEGKQAPETRSDSQPAEQPAEQPADTSSKQRLRRPPRQERRNAPTEQESSTDEFDYQPIGWTCFYYTVMSIAFEVLLSPAPGMSMVVFNPRVWFGLIIVTTLLVTLIRGLRIIRNQVLYIAVSYSLLFIIRLLPILHG
jgi:hypothetical protein